MSNFIWQIYCFNEFVWWNKNLIVTNEGIVTIYGSIVHYSLQVRYILVATVMFDISDSIFC